MHRGRDEGREMGESAQELCESAQEHVLNHLRDVHALELHAMRQFERAARRQDEDTGDVYERHLERSQAHERKIHELVEGHGHEPSVVEDKTLRGRTIGLRQLADIALDTPVKLAMNLFALTHLQIAAYELLAEIARSVEDQDALAAAEEILEDERAAAEELEKTFDRAAESLRDSSEDDVLLGHLSDVHALERQSTLLLELAVEEVGEDEQLKKIYCQHLEQTEEHERSLAQQIESHDAKPSAVKDLHLGAATSGLHGLSAKPPDAQVKITMNLLCVEALEIAAYELLIRLAEASGDDKTADVARKILDQERKAVEQMREGFTRTVELMLESDGSYASARPAESRTEKAEGDDEQAKSPDEGESRAEDPVGATESGH